MQIEQTDTQHIPVPGVEGVTIHIEPMGDRATTFVVRLAVNGRILTTDNVYGVVNDAIPRTVARLLTIGARRYAQERPEWIAKMAAAAAIGAFRKIFSGERTRA